MEEFYIRVKAPFAGYRYFQAGNYRVTMPTMPHSAAYGLVLNLAGIEMRAEKNNMTTLIKNSSIDFNFESEETIPALEIAVGEVRLCEKNSVYQQLHTYPVGNSGTEKERQGKIRKGENPGPSLESLSKGAKFWILPTRREFLINLDVVIGIKSLVDGLKSKVLDGCNGKHQQSRYGLPFAGDNNYLIDFIEINEKPTEMAHWYYPIQQDEIPETETCRLTVGIDRANNHLITMPVFAITKQKSPSPPDTAWIWTPKKIELIEVRSENG
jgi:CRISPR-associated protein Cas5t